MDHKDDTTFDRSYARQNYESQEPIATNVIQDHQQPSMEVVLVKFLSKLGPVLHVVNEIVSLELLGLLIIHQTRAFVEMFAFARSDKLLIVCSSFKDVIPSKIDCRNSFFMVFLET